LAAGVPLRGADLDGRRRRAARGAALHDLLRLALPDPDRHPLPVLAAPAPEERNRRPRRSGAPVRFDGGEGCPPCGGRVIFPGSIPAPRPQPSMKPFVIGIAGGTGSGKTTVARRLYESLHLDSAVFLDQD